MCRPESTPHDIITELDLLKTDAFCRSEEVINRIAQSTYPSIKAAWPRNGRACPENLAAYAAICRRSVDSPPSRILRAGAIGTRMRTEMSSHLCPVVDESLDTIDGSKLGFGPAVGALLDPNDDSRSPLAWAR